MTELLPQELSTAEERAKFIQPIEELHLPSTLDGSDAWEKAWDNRTAIEFPNDIQAVKAWLDGYSGDQMRQACRSAVEKILLWCVVERGHALAKLNGEEVVLFIQFLVAPEPKTRWMTNTAAHRTSADWKPFKVAMDMSRAGATIRLINVYFRWAIGRGLLVAGQPLYALAASLKDGHSAMASSNRPLTLHPIATPEWVVLHQYLQGEPESYKDLQVLGFHQMLYYGAISQKQIARLRLKDFVAHQRDGLIVAWEFPSGSGKSTVFSCGPLTSTLTMLLGLTPVPPGANRREQLPFEGCGVRAANAFKRAKTQARAFFQNAGEVDRGASLSKVNLVHLRGAVIKNAEREAASLNLALVFSRIYLVKYPHINRYVGAQIEDTEKRLEGAAKLSNWIVHSEQTHLLNFQRLAAQPSETREIEQARSATRPAES